MALATSKAHVSLNGEDYILIEESYEKRAQQPFTARFATGDPSEGDNSFWQFLSQRGWVSEGQEIFSVVNNFRQSSGWDIRGNQAGSLGHPRIGYGIESLALLNTIPTPYSAIAAHTFEDFALGTVDWAKWNDGQPVNGTGLIVRPASCLTVGGGAYGCQTGFYQGLAHGGISDSGSDNPATPPVQPARYASQPSWHYTDDSLGGYTSDGFVGQVGATGLSLGNTGDYSFDVYIRNSASRIHAGVGFLMNSAGGGYLIEISGAGGTTIKLIKTTSATVWNNSSDTVLKTWTATSKINTLTTFTVSIAAGTFTMKQDGSTLAGGTVADTTYTTGNCIRFITAYAGTGAEVTVGNFVVPASAASASAACGKFIQYNNQLILAYNANSVSDFTFTNLVARSQASNLPAITYLKARDICVWNRDGDVTGGANSVTGVGSFLCAVAGTTFKCYSGTTVAYTTSVSSTGGLIIPVNSNTILIIGTSAENSGLIVIDRLIFNADTWTLTNTVGSAKALFNLDGGVEGQLANSFAFDSNGTLHFASNDLSGTTGGLPSRVYQITAADLLATYPTISAVTTVPDFCVRGIAELYNSTNNLSTTAIYLLGAAIEGNATYSAIMRFPGELVYKSTKGRLISGGSQADLFNYGIASFISTAKNIRFLSQTDDDTWDPIVELDVDQFFREVASFSSGQFTYNNPNAVAIAEWNGRFYCLNAQAGTIQRTLAVRGGLGTTFDSANPLGSCILKLSDMGRNTSLISKSLFSVYLEISSPLPASTTWSEYSEPSTSRIWSVGNNDLVITVGGVVVGILTSTVNPSLTAGHISATLCTLQNGGLYRAEMLLPFELTASIFTPRIQANAANAWTGFLKYFMLKYVPTQFKKRAWGFGIRATKRLKLGDGSHELRTPAEMFADIEAAWASNTPLTFIDVDQVSYSVLITDFKQKRPLLSIDRLSESEAFYFLEALEV